MKMSLVIFALLFAVSAQSFGADDSDSSSPSKLTEARTAIDAGRYERAIELLDQANRDSPGNADVLNLLGFSHRKLERFDEALGFYRKALAVEPEHRGANEYLGELYLQTDQLAKAEERLEVLDGACFFSCAEYDELKAAIEAYKKKKGS